ncbi:uncharacterized protein [Battus philenor]|uniref:uncharacterized protein n=1 Tax=Battus philenor TaxID=42288 RepID=UPI0035CE9FE2
MFPVTRRISPSEFCNLSRPLFFNEFEQQDCSEYLIHILNSLITHEQLPVLNAEQQNSSDHPSDPQTASETQPSCSNSSPPDDALPSSSSSGASNNKRSTKSFVDELFKSVLGTNIHCSGCQSVSVSSSNFHELLVTIPESRKDNVCVQSLIDAYCSSELLTGSAMYNCNVCNGPQLAVRVNLFLSTPKYLIVVMNNFKYDKRLQVQKIFVGSIHCNNEVTLPTWIPMEKTYQLYAAVIHESPFAQTGHYYTLAKDDTEWYLFNDDNVTQVNENYLQSLDSCCTPYLLFYKRTDIEDTYKPSIEDVPLKFRRLLHKRSKTPKV